MYTKLMSIYGGPYLNCLFISLHQRTPLQWAVIEGHMDIVKSLIVKGADINIKDKNGVSDWLAILTVKTVAK